MLLSCSVDTVLGDVFADSTSAGSEGIMAQQHQGCADIRRQGSSAHMAAYSTVRLSQTEEARQSAARSGPPVTCHACQPYSTMIIMHLFRGVSVFQNWCLQEVKR